MRKYSKTPEKGTILVSERLEPKEALSQQEGEDAQAERISTVEKTED
jgi:hypothetical protein